MKRSFKGGASLFVLRTAILCGLSGPAFAQVAANQAPANDSIETVVVTSERVSENLQKVPLSVSAFSGQQIQNSHIETLADIALRTPGFTAGGINPVESNLAIRGIGSAEGISQNAAGDPSVVEFLDGVYVGRGGIADLDAYDLERVEVLRGPQGTLFGKNAIGGLVQIISKKPTDVTSYDLSGTIGNYDTIDIAGHFNIPLTDDLYFAAGVSHKSHSGFEYNETTGNHVDDENLSTVQGQLRWVPTSNFEMIFGADYTHQDQKGQPRHNICDASLDNGVHCVGVNPDPRVVDAYTDGYIRRDLVTLHNEINWTTSLGVVTSITGFRDVRLGYLTPFFSNPVNPPNQIESTEIDQEKDNQFSQELRLAFNAFDNRLDGVLGGYYLHEDNDRVEGLIQDFPAPSISGTASYPQSVSANSSALFAQGNYHILDDLTATVGARMTWESKSGEFAGFLVSGVPGALPPPLVADYDVHASKSWDAFTPHFGLSWQTTDDVLLYVTASRGFKSGGYQGIAGYGPSAATPYDPEYAWSYEGGAKTQWFDDHLRLNASIYQTDYSNLQVSQLIPLKSVVVSNAATARIRGAELEFIGRINSDFQIDGSYAYMDAKYLSFEPGTSDYSGNTLTRAPDNKFNVGAQYAHEFGDWSMFARLDYLYTAKYYFDPSNDPVQTQPAYSMWDARAAVTLPGDKLEVAVWGKNLGNKLVATYVTAFPPYGQTLVPYAPPRTFGLTVTFRD